MWKNSDQRCRGKKRLPNYANIQCCIVLNVVHISYVVYPHTDHTTNNASPRPSTSTKIAPKPSTTNQNTLRSDLSSQSNTPPRPSTRPNQHTPRPSSSEPYTTPIPITTTYHMPLSSTSQHVTPRLISPSYHIQIYRNLTLVNHYSTTSILPVPSSTSIPFEKPTFVTSTHKRHYPVLLTSLSTSICTLFILAICIKSKLYTRCRRNSRQLAPNHETIDISPVRSTSSSGSSTEIYPVSSV